MQPTSATLASGGAAGAAVIVLSWLVATFIKVAIPDYVQMALMVLLTWGAGKFFHALPPSSPGQKGDATFVARLALALLGVSACALCFALAACAPDIKALSGDPATLSVHQVTQGPMWTVTTDVSRVNSTNTAATSGATGTAVNVPPNAVVNSAPAKPVAGVTTQGNSPSPSGTTLSPAPSPGN